jgi:DNA-binding response OmpR family regulator
MTCAQMLKNLSVLLVEDEHSLAHLLRDAIGDRFRDLSLAYDGKEGLKAAEKRLPDLVITDITMPHMNGLEMSASLRERHPKLPIVILSAYSEKEYLLEAIDIGITKYLIKPFDPDELLEVICTLAKKLGTGERVPLLPPFAFDVQNKKLFAHGVMVRLSRRENLFIDRLLSSPNHFLPTDSIKEALWEEEDVSDERLRVFINRIRKKTDDNLIENIVGQGYMLNAQSPAKASA